MHYRISVKIDQPGEGIICAWYAGRRSDVPRFETDVRHSKVLHYYHLENAEKDKAFLEGQPELCHGVEIVTFDEVGQRADDASDERPHASTVELEELSAFEILEDVQEILTKMITPGAYAQTNRETRHEQIRTALSLVLRAISILRKEKRRDRGQG